MSRVIIDYFNIFGYLYFVSFMPKNTYFGLKVIRLSIIIWKSQICRYMRFQILTLGHVVTL